MKQAAVLFFLASAILAQATPGFAPAWYPAGTTFATNGTLVVGGTNLSSVIAADIYGNGRLALISVSSGATNFPGTLTVLTNNGNGFGSNATYTVAGTLSAVAAADLNGDGYVDLLCTSTNGTLLVLTNNGAGIFASNAVYSIGPDPLFVTAADLNGDGRLDVVTANFNFGNSGTLTVLTNNGSGILVSNASYSVGSGPRSIAVTDVNGDGYADLISANQNSSSLTVLTNNGNGRFVFSATILSLTLPTSVISADVNADGHPDLICTDESANELTVLTNNGSGKFTVSSTVGQGGPAIFNVPFVVALATNFNGRGQMALVVANGGGTTLTVVTNNGSGIFGSNAVLNVGSGPGIMAVADFNGDGRPDVAVPNGGTNTVTVLFNTTIFYNTTFTVGGYGSLAVSATGSPPPALTVTNATLPAGVTLAVNANGTATLGGTPAIGSGGAYSLLLVASNNVFPYIATQRVSLTINQPPIFRGALFGSNANYKLSSSTAVGSFAMADLNGDAKPDLIYANYFTANTLTVLTNNGSGVFGSNANLNAGVDPQNVLAADVNGDGFPDLLSEDFSGGSRLLVVLTNNGAGIFSSNYAVSLGFTSQGSFGGVALKDINGDGRVDLAYPNYSGNTVTVLTNNGSGVFSNNATYTVGSEPFNVVAADLNGNGRVALICENAGGSGSLTLLTNNGSGSFSLSATINTGTQLGQLVTADINGNGKLALIYGRVVGTNGNLIVLTNNGSGVFGSNATYTITGNGSSFDFVATDVNGDGKVDLIAQTYGVSPSYTSALTVLTNNGNGGFGSNAVISAGIQGARIEAADINGDGRMDLVYEGGSSLGGEWVTVLTNALPSVSPALTEAAAGAYTLAATGYPTPVFSESGALPGGVSFSAGGTFSGSPNTGSAGTYGIVVTASNIFGVSSQTVNLAVNPAVSLATNVFSTAENASLMLSTNDLLAGATDQDGFAFGLTSVGTASTNGGAITFDSGSGLYTYTPVGGFTGLDEFYYTAADSNGDSAQGTVLVIVTPPGNPPYNTVATTLINNNLIGFQFTGIPSQTYYIQVTTNLSGPYTDIVPAIVADSNGQVSRTISISATSPGEYFRVSNSP